MTESTAARTAPTLTDEHIAELWNFSTGGSFVPPDMEAFARAVWGAGLATVTETFQARVDPWLVECFGEAIARDPIERNHRFLEEAIELAQACDCTRSEAHQLVDYVFGRPVGDGAQEVGGVMVTLAALCLAQGVDMHAAGETELARVWTKIDVIRAKHAAKPKHSPLPGASTTTPAAPPITDRQRAAALVVADWANRRTDSLDGWINELLTLREHYELRGIPAFAHTAMLTIAHGLARHRPDGFVHDATEHAADLLAIGTEQEHRYATMIGEISDALGLTETEQFEAKGADKILERIAALELATSRAPLPLMHEAFRTTETEGDPDPAKRRYSMIFGFPSLAALQAAEAEWIAFDRAARAVTQGEPSLDEILCLADEESEDSLENGNRIFTREGVAKFARRMYDRGASTQGDDVQRCEQLRAFGWQVIECPACGSVGAVGYPRAAIASAQAPGAMKWQPIETAPKDGKSILVSEAASRGGVFIAHWLEWSLDPMRTGWQTNGHLVRATHWMPLPPLPATPGADQ